MSRKPPGYWDDWKNVEEALRPVITRLGRFPTTGEIRLLPGASSIDKAIIRAGGVQKVAAMFETLSGRHSPGHWQNWGNVEDELRPLIAKLGRMPTREELEGLQKSSLHQAIVTNFGGLTAVAQRLGIGIKQRPKGYWQSWSNVEQELRQLIASLARFPTIGELRAHKRGRLLSAIVQYHGGVVQVRKRVSWNPLSASLFDRYIDHIAEAFMRDHGDAASFENFLAELERECRYERDLRVRLGLPPEPPTLREAEIGAPTDNVGAEPTEDQ